MWDETKKAALYCRVAHADAIALETQRLSLREFAKTLGFADCAEYLDDGVSGLTLSRPAFSRMEADIRAGRIHTVLVRDVSRVCRGFIVFHRWLRDIQERGVSLISQQEGMIESAGGLGRISVAKPGVVL